MTPPAWRARARAALCAQGETRCFVRFARQGAPALFVTDARDVRSPACAGFCVRAQSGGLCLFDPPDDWYASKAGKLSALPCTREQALMQALARRFAQAKGADGSVTPQGRALLRETARVCFAPGARKPQALRALRAHAALLQRAHDTGAFMRAAILVWMAQGPEGFDQKVEE